MTLDFFNHETKHTDSQGGFNPEFDTIFSFKNVVDEFYLKYFEKNHVLIEVFAIKTNGPKTSEKIGEAKLPLSAVLQNDQSF